MTDQPKPGVYLVQFALAAGTEERAREGVYRQFEAANAELFGGERNVAMMGAAGLSIAIFGVSRLTAREIRDRYERKAALRPHNVLVVQIGSEVAEYHWNNLGSWLKRHTGSSSPLL